MALHGAGMQARAIEEAGARRGRTRRTRLDAIASSFRVFGVRDVVVIVGEAELVAVEVRLRRQFREVTKSKSLRWLPTSQPRDFT
jgi:hypothetical protein